MRRVCFLLNNDFTRDARVRREAETLAKAGYQVTVIALRGSKDTPHSEDHGNLHIRRVLKKRLFRTKAITSRTIFAIWTILRSFGRFDAVHAHDANMLPTGWVLSRLWFCPLIYDSHEYWGAIFQEERLLTEKQPDSKQKRKYLSQIDFFTRLETWLLPQCRAVITVNDSIADILKKRSKNRIPQCVVIRNSCPAMNTQKTQLLRDEFKIPEGWPIILYQGMMAKKRGLSTLLEAMELLDNMALVMMGPILPNDADYCHDLFAHIFQSPKLRQCVFYKGPVPSSDIAHVAASADLGVSPILDWGENHTYSLPNKVFEYIQAGLPIGVSELPELKKLVESHGVGFTFKPGRVKDIARKIEHHFASDKRRNRILTNVHQAKQHLTWENEQKRLLDLYQDILPLTASAQTSSQHAVLIH